MDEYEALEGFKEFVLPVYKGNEEAYRELRHLIYDNVGYRPLGLLVYEDIEDSSVATLNIPELLNYDEEKDNESLDLRFINFEDLEENNLFVISSALFKKTLLRCNLQNLSFVDSLNIEVKKRTD